MNLHLIREQILSLPEVSSFTELKDLLHKTADREGASWDYCFNACESVGGSATQAVHAAGANLCLLISIHLVDDLLDNDPKGLYHQLGSGTTANMSLAFQSIASKLIIISDLAIDAKFHAIDSLAQMMLSTSLAQQQDVTTTDHSEAAYWAITQRKTPPLISSALFTGALCGGADFSLAEHISQLGLLYGQMIQVSDDISDVFKDFVTTDWKMQGNNLAMIYCREADYEEKEEFNLLLKIIDEPGSLDRAQQLVIRSGALSYCMYHLFAINKKLRDEIDKLAIIQKNKLIAIADGLIEPSIELMIRNGIVGIDDVTKMNLPAFDKQYNKM
jgi:geranylgeranyl pyrophosphate synthase